MSLIDMVGGNDYIAVSRTLCRAFGPNTAVMYSELIDRYKYYIRVGWLDDEGMFFATISDIQEKTGLSEEQQASCLKKLKEHQLVFTKRKGLPSKRYIFVYENPEFLRVLFDLNHDEARNIQNPENPVTSSRKTREQDTGKPGNKIPENPAQTNLINKPNIQTHNNNVVVEIFAKNQINIKPAIKKHPTFFTARCEAEWEIIASTLAAAKAAGKITNPVGLLITDPEGVAEACLTGRFYADPPGKGKNKPTYDDTSDIYLSPVVAERLRLQAQSSQS